MLDCVNELLLCVHLTAGYNPQDPGIAVHDLRQGTRLCHLLECVLFAVHGMAGVWRLNQCSEDRERWVSAGTSPNENKGTD